MLTKTARQVQVDLFTSDPNYCPITYQLQNSDGSAPDAEVITFDPVLRVLTFDYQDTTLFPSKERLADFKIVATSVSQTVSLPFKVDFQNPCKLATKTINLPWSDFGYSVYAPAVT